jgi:LysM domain
MSALPVEQQPSGAIPADTDRGPRGPRPRMAGRPARRDEHPLFPGKRAVLPDGDCVFPGGGDRFSSASQSYARRSSPRSSRPAPAQRSSAGSLISIQQETGTAPLAGPGAEGIARAARPAGLGPARRVPASLGPARRVPARLGPARPVPARLEPASLGRPVLVGRPVSAPRAAGAVPSRRIRLTRRGRIVVAALAVVAACGLFVAGASAAQASSPAAAHAATGSGQRIIVQPGSTLWSIAESADPHADARTVVQEMLQANRLKTADITAGQRLWVPRG